MCFVFKMTNQDVAAQPGNIRGIDNRQLNIGERIEDGIRTGCISQRERAGVVTPQEHRQLRSELTHLNDDLERMIRNGRRARPEALRAHLKNEMDTLDGLLIKAGVQAN